MKIYIYGMSFSWKVCWKGVYADVHKVKRIKEEFTAYMTALTIMWTRYLCKEFSLIFKIKGNCEQKKKDDKERPIRYEGLHRSLIYGTYEFFLHCSIHCFKTSNPGDIAYN